MPNTTCTRLSPEAVEQIDCYIGEYNKDPFSAQTIEEGMKILNAVAETRRKRCVKP
jgi:hypothetical protein